MADIETKEVAPAAAEKEVTSSVKESPVKETNGSAKEVVAEDKAENGSGDNGVAEMEAEDAPKENGEAAQPEEEVKENGDSAEEVCSIKRKSCAGEADATEAATPEKKAKLAEKEEDSPIADESNDAEAVEA